MKRLSTSLSLYFPFYAQQPTDLWRIFPQLLNYSLKRGFLVVLLLFLLSFLLLFLQQSDALWTCLSLLLHSPLKNFPLLLLLLFSPVFNDRTFSSDSSVSYVFLPFGCVFQNQHVYFLKSLDSIFVMLTLKDTLTGLYHSGKT